jgi:hypothetical protein
MSRSGYNDDCDNDWSFVMWRGAVASAIKGKRGQGFLKEMLAAMDMLPVKRLAANELEAPDHISCSHWGLHEAESVCAIGSVGKARGIDMSKIDPEDYEIVADKFGIARAMAQEIVWINDEAGPWKETPEQRFERVRNWIVGEIKNQESAA